MARASGSLRIYLILHVVFLLTVTLSARAADCNNNLIENEADIATGLSRDCDLNKVPDECDLSVINFGAPASFFAALEPESVVVDWKTNAGTSVVLDLNNDGFTDLVVSNEASHSLWVFFGNGGGTFAFQQSIALGSSIYPEMVVAGDFDGNGTPDLAVTSEAPNEDCSAPQANGGTLKILLNIDTQPGGPYLGFQSPVTYTAGSGAEGAAVADLDGDGDLDIGVAMECPDTVWVFWNNGSGSFSTPSPTILSLGLITPGFQQYGPQSLVVAQLDAQAGLDIAVTDEKAGKVAVFFQTGFHTFTSPLSLTVGTRPWGVAASDLDGNGVLDLAVANRGNTTQTDTVSVLRNLGNRSFAAKVDFSVGDGARSILAADLDADGKSDLAVTNENRANVSVLRGTGTAGVVSFRPVVNFDIRTVQGDTGSSSPVWISRQVLQSGGTPMLFVVTKGVPAVQQAGTVTLLPPAAPAALDCNGNGISDGCDIASLDFSPHVDYGVGAYPRSMAVADVNGDAKIDIVAGNFDSHTLSVLQQGANGSYSEAAGSPYTVGFFPTSVVASRFDPNGGVDVAIASAQFAQLTVLLNSGAGTFIASTQSPINLVPADAEPRAIASADFDNDGDNDLVLTDTNHDRVFRMRNNGAATFTALGEVDVSPPFEFAVTPVTLAAADVDGDGDIDLAVGNLNSDNVTFMRNTGGFSLIAEHVYAVDGDPNALAVADFDADGKPDLAVATPAGAVVLRNTGNAIFTEPGATYPLALGAAGISASDLDGDGDIDLALTNGDSVDNVLILRNVGNGTFTGPLTMTTNASPTAILAADLNADRLADLVTISAGGSPGTAEVFLHRVVRLSLNCDANGVPDECEFPGCGGALLGDLTCDGRVDGRDIQPFSDHILAQPVWYACQADMNQDHSMSGLDVPLFACRLLGLWPTCTSSYSPPPPPMPDCNSNGIDDAADIAALTSIDCNTDGVPDECQLAWNDCNSNGVLDVCDVDPADPDGDSQVYPDCNNSGLPDACDLELAFLPSYDCNENVIPDECDIVSYYSADANSNGIPDECEGGGMQMMAGGGAGGESANSTAADDSAGSETVAGVFDNPAWIEFFEWQMDERDALAAMSREERFNATRAKLSQLGLPDAIPWARVEGAAP